MGYEEDKEEESLRKKSELVKGLIVEIDKALERYFDRLTRYDEEKRRLKQKGIGTGLDEALHAIGVEIGLEILKTDNALRSDLREYIVRSLKDHLLPVLEGQALPYETEPAPPTQKP